MAVNTSALKVFAPAMRRQLIDGVGRKLDLLINTKTPDILTTYAKQIENLREEQDTNREKLIEKVAYTWFNRLCALRFLDAKGWHPFACKVLMPAEQGETQPELLKLMRSGSLPNELKRFTNEQRLNNLLDNQIPTALQGGDPQAEIYRELVLASCRSYNHLLPDLFEAIDDETELLLPDDLLTESSIAGRFRNDISDEDCEDVEIIGWLYQFYISEKKDEVIGKVVKSEDIPAATQLFTPNWIVKYMVQNTIGAKWLETYPDSSLREQMEFYIEPAEQIDEVKSQLAEITPTSLNPEALTLMDPACGSGHILVEAYNIFKEIYLEQGYQRTEIPELILTKNLYGLDICPRAAQLATFSLLMKGREDDRKLLESGVKLNILALQNSTAIDTRYLEKKLDFCAYGISQSDMQMLFNLFINATSFGSLIQVPQALAQKTPRLKQFTQQTHTDLIVNAELHQLEQLVHQAEILAMRFEVVVTNPPYMGSKSMNSSIKEFAKIHYPNTKSDLFSISSERVFAFTKSFGLVGVMTPFTWMFLKSFEELRILILEEMTLLSLIELEYHAFYESAYVPICTFVAQKNHEPYYEGTFIKLSNFYGAHLQPQKTLEAIKDPICDWLYKAKANDLQKIPGKPIVYWLSDQVRDLFEVGKRIIEIAPPKQGLITGDNNRFLRYWHEVSFQKTSLVQKSKSKWYPLNKGGQFRKWYGNQEYVVNWEDDGIEIKNFKDINGRILSRPQNLEYNQKEHVSWSLITSGHFSVRYYDSSFSFNVAGISCFPSRNKIFFLISFLNTKIANYIVRAINPSLNTNVGDIGNLPIVEIDNFSENLPSNLIKHEKNDWDSYEISWNFQKSPVLSITNNHAPTLECKYDYWINQNKNLIAETTRLEEENNRIFINAYGLADEIKPEVPIDQITLTVNPAYRYGGSLSEKDLQSRFQCDTMVELLSYATGCMMGRYSLDHPGLILADTQESQESQISAYEAKVGKQISDTKFKPDFDGIIPVLDGEWFEDDIVARTREFIAVTFPESSIADNLRFIENSIGKDIRKYFCRDFYKDHLQTYKKRPIYWMVQSPNAGFACLIYLHRYTPETLLQVLNDYFRPYVQKLEARLTLLDLDQVNDSLSKREQIAARKEAEKINKVIKECQDWEKEILLPLAQKRIKLDLDDGVKVNYLKLQEVLAKIPGLKAKGKK